MTRRYAAAFAAAMLVLFVFGAGAGDARPERFKEATVTVNGVALDVLVADTPNLRRKGFLGFTVETFPAEGILFVFPEEDSYLFHTQGMHMPIYIMTLDIDGGDGYRVTSSVYAPRERMIRLPESQWVLEVTERVFEERIKPALPAAIRR